MRDADGLTPKQARFAQEYLVDLNASQACIRAGYSRRNANVVGARLLANVRIAAVVAKAAEKRKSKLDTTADRVLDELARIALLDPALFFDTDGRLKSIHEIPEDARRAIAGLEIEVLYEGRGESRQAIGTLHKMKLVPKDKALEMLGKYRKLFTEKHEVTGADGAPLSLDVAFAAIKAKRTAGK